jgi:hypothetical protein
LNDTDDLATRLEAIAAAVRGWRYTCVGEKALQASLGEALSRAGIAWRREVPVASGTLDFLVDGGIAIEVKTGGSLAALTRQVHRYLGEESLRAVLVVSTRAILDRLPPEIGGKPVRVVVLTGSLLP